MISCISDVGFCSKHSEDGNALAWEFDILCNILHRPPRISRRLFSKMLDIFEVFPLPQYDEAEMVDALQQPE